MKRFLEVLILVPLAIVLILLAIANRAPVTLSVNPLDPAAPGFTIAVPLFWVIFAALAIGVVLGGVAVWLHQGRYRKAARQSRREAERMRAEAERARVQAAAAPPRQYGPALPAPGKASTLNPVTVR